MDSDGDAIALQGVRGPPGEKGSRGVAGPVESRGSLENVVLTDPKALLERLAKWDLLEEEVELEHVVKKATRETLVMLVIRGLQVHRVERVQEV